MSFQSVFTSERIFHYNSSALRPPPDNYPHFFGGSFVSVRAWKFPVIRVCNFESTLVRVRLSKKPGSHDERKDQRFFSNDKEIYRERTILFKKIETDAGAFSLIPTPTVHSTR